MRSAAKRGRETPAGISGKVYLFMRIIPSLNFFGCISRFLISHEQRFISRQRYPHWPRKFPAIPNVEEPAGRRSESHLACIHTVAVEDAKPTDAGLRPMRRQPGTRLRAVR